MRYLSPQASLEAALCVAAAALASLLRDGGTTSELPQTFIAASIVGGIAAVCLSGLARTFWRHPSLADLGRIAVAACIATSVTALLCFAINRLDGVARSLPALHGLLYFVLLCLGRILARANYHRRLYVRMRQMPTSLLVGAAKPPPEGVLVLGLNSVSRAFISATSEFSYANVKVVGIIANRPRQVGRIFSGLRVLGGIDDLRTCIDELEVRGISVKRIAVCVPFSALPRKALAALAAVTSTDQIELQMVCDDLGFGQKKVNATTGQPISRFAMDAVDLDAMLRRPYWRVKRVIDCIAAAILLVLAMPFLLFGGIAVALSLGFPIMFWQQRPGRGGIPFRVYKLRTMRGAVAPDGRRLADAQRRTFAGDWLRRTRLDELAQLWNILVGEMSFIGPRPLLPIDQDASYVARLVVRPGLTGWAQVVGGRIITAEDKAALDVWYIVNASFRLDLKILARTVIMVIEGEKEHRELIHKSWSELAALGLVAGPQRLSPGDAYQFPQTP